MYSSQRRERGAPAASGYGGGCSELYLGFIGRDPSSTMNVATSSDGVNWSGTTDLFTNAAYGPSLRGGTGNMGIAYSTVNTSIGPYPITADRTFNCDLSNLSPENDAFFTDCVPPSPCTTTSGGTPAWTLADGSNIDIRASAPGGGYPFYYQLGTNPTTQWRGNWSPNGIAATAVYSPTFEAHYIAWQGGGTPSINIADVDATAYQITCSDTTASAPALTIFGGELWVAWRSSSDNTVNVASLTLF